jgi:hypothetical protein
MSSITQITDPPPPSVPQSGPPRSGAGASAISRVIRWRMSTGQAWIAADPILDANEPAKDLTTGKVKYGDGERRFSELPWFEEDDPNVAPELPNQAMHLIAEEHAQRAAADLVTTDLKALYILTST